MTDLAWFPQGGKRRALAPWGLRQVDLIDADGVQDVGAAVVRSPDRQLVAGPQNQKAPIGAPSFLHPLDEAGQVEVAGLLFELV